MNELALFAGAGGGILGGHLLGWRTICAVEFNSYAAGVLLARQNDGVLPTFPIWDDVRTFDGRPWRGRVDVVSGGFPCQDISAAGRGEGITGARSGLWGEMARIIREVEPRYVFVENSPMLTSRGLGRVLGDLAAMGYDARWCVLGAADVGAPHQRDRIWIMADSNRMRELQPQRSLSDQRRRPCDCGKNVANANIIGRNKDSSSGKLWPGWAEQSSENPRISNSAKEREEPKIRHADSSSIKGSRIPGGIHAKHSISNVASAWWDTDPADTPESGLGRVANGVAARVDRLKAIGNGQVSAVAALAWETLKP